MKGISDEYQYIIHEDAGYAEYFPVKLEIQGTNEHYLKFSLTDDMFRSGYFLYDIL